MNKLILGLLAAILLLGCVTTYKVYTPAKVALGVATPSDQITNWTGGGSFGGDLAVGGDLTVTGSSTFSGNVSGVAKALSQSMSSSATTTACSFQNLSSASRVIVGAGVVDLGTALSLGSVAWTAGTSTAAGGVTPTGTKVLNTTITRANGTEVITTTSTAQTAYSKWGVGEYFVFQTGTTTNAGTCRVLYY